MTARPARLSRSAVLLLAVLALLLVAGGAYAAHRLQDSATTTVSASAAAMHPPPLFGAAPLRVVQAPLRDAERRADADARTWLDAHRGATPAAFAAWAQTQVPPPPSRTAAQRAELAFLHRLPARTPAGDVADRWLEQHGFKDVWKLYLKQYRQLTGPTEGTRAKAVLKAALAIAKQLQATEKRRFARPSPYETDPSLDALNQGRFTHKFSYPSKHATMAVAAATVLGRLEPLRAPEFDRMLEQVLYSRLDARGHYPSDLAAGERLGRLIADYALRGRS